MTIKHKPIISFLLIVLIIMLFVPLAVAGTVTIAVVKDGDSYFDKMIPLIKEELSNHLEAEDDIQFKESAQFNAQWNTNKIRSVLQAALDDPEVDYILVTGPRTTQEALSPGRNLKKPVLSSFVQMSDVFLPEFTKEGKSKTKNASFIIVPDRVTRDIQVFNEMVGFSKLKILVSSIDKDFIEFLKNKLPKYEERTGISLEFVTIASDDIDRSLKKIEGSEAVYITYMPQLSARQRQELINGINRRKVPSYSVVGHSDVRLGVLAAQTPDMIQQVVRRMALNFIELIRGTDVTDLPVILPVDTALLVNGETASIINYVPDLETQISANIIRSEYLEEAGVNLTLQQAFKLAEKGNTALSIRDSTMETAKQNRNLAGTDLMPQAFLGLSYTSVDSDRARTLATVSKELTSSTVRVSQVLFDDETISDLRASIRLFEGSQEEREASRLDAISNGGISFLQYSLARELFRIETDNLRVTEDNLELAKLRYDVGHSGKDEVFRWEAELYQRRQAVFESKANVEAQRIAFNQVLGTDQNKRWQPIRIDVDPEEFLFLGGNIRNIIKKRHVQKEGIRRFLVDLALENAPEIKFLKKTTEAKQIEVNQLKRRFVLPTVTANFDYTDEINRAGGARLAGLDDEEYAITIAATYPLFEGGGKYFEVKRAKSELEGLDKQVKFAAEITEQRARTAIRNIESSFPSIKFSLMSADSARKNLDIVQEKYSQGTVNVTDLLEAQNQSFVSDQDAAIALYTYLIDLVEFQRSISWFEDEKPQNEKKKFIDSLSKHLKGM